MNEEIILENISQQDIKLWANNDEHLGFKAIEWLNSGNNHYAILMSTYSNKFYRIKYDGRGCGVKEVERKERTETIVNYEEVIK